MRTDKIREGIHREYNNVRGDKRHIKITACRQKKPIANIMFLRQEKIDTYDSRKKY
jgi:hypothetical protein